MSDTQAAQGDGFDDEVRVQLYQDLNPPENLKDGGLRTKPTKDDGLYHYSGKNSPYTVIIRRLVAIDGQMSPTTANTSPQRSSLLIFDCRAICTDTDGRYSSIRMWMDFTDLEETPPTEQSMPRVVAWAPFHTLYRWDESEMENKSTTSGGLEAGVSQPATVKIKLNKSRENTGQQKCFIEGSADPRYNDAGVRNGVRWALKQNASHNDGVPPEFRVAVLLERQTNASIRLSFGFRCCAGPWQSLQDGAKYWFGRGKNCDLEKDYIPNDKAPRFFEEEGKALLVDIEKKIGKDNMNLLADIDKKQLLALTKVWGLDPLQAT